MGLCSADLKKKRPFKTIIVPRGLINPNEHNIIEIPMSMSANNNFIVKGPGDLNSCFSVEPYRGDICSLPPCPDVTIQVMNSPDTCPGPSFANTVNSSCVNVELSENPCNGPLNPPPCSDILPPCSRTPSCSSREYFNDRPARSRVDFSCQTQLPSTVLCPPGSTVERCQQTPSSSSFYGPQSAHSPLCPICSKASCKYLTNAGLSHSYSTQSPFRPSIYRDNFRFPSGLGARSDILSRSSLRMETEMINQILNEKIEKILKPVLYSLTKLPLDDDDDLRCPSRPDYICLQPKRSPDSMERRCGSTLNEHQHLQTSDFDEFCRGARRRDSEYLESSGLSGRSRSAGSRIDPNVILGSSQGRDTDYENLRRPYSADRDYSLCSDRTSCQRRSPNVSFRDKMDDTRDDDKSIDNASFISCSNSISKKSNQ